MFRGTVLLALALGTVSFLSGEDLAMSKREWVGKPFSSMFSEFEKVTIYPNSRDRTLVAVCCDREPAWWSHIRVFQHHEDKIAWAATFPKDYLENRGHYVVSCSWVSIEGLKNPVLELVESTHRGNGTLWLLELRDKTFRTVLHTPVMGRYWKPDPAFAVPEMGEATFVDGGLSVEYTTATGQNAHEVRLKGSVSVTDMSGKKIAIKPYEEVWLWNKAAEIFQRVPQK